MALVRALALVLAIACCAGCGASQSRPGDEGRAQDGRSAVADRFRQESNAICRTANATLGRAVKTATSTSELYVTLLAAERQALHRLRQVRPPRDMWLTFQRLRRVLAVRVRIGERMRRAAAAGRMSPAAVSARRNSLSYQANALTHELRLGDCPYV
jgi:hypothetical protein